MAEQSAKHPFKRGWGNQTADRLEDQANPEPKSKPGDWRTGPLGQPKPEPIPKPGWYVGD